MPDFNVRADSVNVEQIMEQIRARIREKRGVDYTEDQIRELASVKLEKFLDPRGVRSDLLDQFKRAQLTQAPPAPPNYRFEEDTLFETHRGPVRFIRRLLQPLLKLMFNPGPLIQALHIQSELNTLNAQQATARRGLDQLYFEVVHNLVLETTRMGIEVKNLKMRVESLTSRLEFNERRARALESVVVYKPSETADSVARTPPAPQPDRPRQQERRGEPRERDRNRPAPEPRPQTSAGEAAAEPAPQAAATIQSGTPEGPGAAEGPGQRSRRRRRRRGRRGGGSVATIMGEAPGARPSGASGAPEAEPFGAEDVEQGGDDLPLPVNQPTTARLTTPSTDLAAGEPSIATDTEPATRSEASSVPEPQDQPQPDRGTTGSDSSPSPLREPEGRAGADRGTTGSGHSGEE